MHSCCHPCCWCDVEKSDFWKRGTQKTIASLNSLFWDYFEENTNKKEAKHYSNVIHFPIVSNNLENKMPVIDVLLPSELDLLIGPVNTLYDGLEKVCPRNKDWLKLCNNKKFEYRGGKFEGNTSRVLLKKVDQVLNDVVVACYGYKLAADYVTKIKKFSRAYLDLAINVTPKVHAVIHHVQEFCTLTDRGLGPWSEQAS